MEMLEHLIEGQYDGKTARDIFGNDPKGYADEIISQLPPEEKRDLVKFFWPNYDKFNWLVFSDAKYCHLIDWANSRSGYN